MAQETKPTVGFMIGQYMNVDLTADEEKRLNAAFGQLPPRQLQSLADGWSARFDQGRNADPQYHMSVQDLLVSGATKVQADLGPAAARDVAASLQTNVAPTITAAAARAHPGAPATISAPAGPGTTPPPPQTAAPPPQAPAPAPTPPPATAPAATPLSVPAPQVSPYEFALGSAVLSQKQKDQLAQAVKDWKAAGSHDAFVVQGRTDTTGDKSHYDNYGLAQRRAKVVADELERLGVPKNQIYAIAHHSTESQIEATGEDIANVHNRSTQVSRVDPAFALARPLITVPLGRTQPTEEPRVRDPKENEPRPPPANDDDERTTRENGTRPANERPADQTARENTIPTESERPGKPVVAGTGSTTVTDPVRVTELPPSSVRAPAEPVPPVAVETTPSSPPHPIAVEPMAPTAVRAPVPPVTRVPPVAADPPPATGSLVQDVRPIEPTAPTAVRAPVPPVTRVPPVATEPPPATGSLVQDVRPGDAPPGERVPFSFNDNGLRTGNLTGQSILRSTANDDAILPQKNVDFGLGTGTDGLTIESPQSLLTPPGEGNILPFRLPDTVARGPMPSLTPSAAPLPGSVVRIGNGNGGVVSFSPSALPPPAPPPSVITPGSVPRVEGATTVSLAPPPPPAPPVPPEAPVAVVEPPPASPVDLRVHPATPPSVGGPRVQAAGIATSGLFSLGLYGAYAYAPQFAADLNSGNSLQIATGTGTMAADAGLGAAGAIGVGARATSMIATRFVPTVTATTEAGSAAATTVEAGSVAANTVKTGSVVANTVKAGSTAATIAESGSTVATVAEGVLGKIATPVLVATSVLEIGHGIATDNANEKVGGSLTLAGAGIGAAVAGPVGAGVGALAGQFIAPGVVDQAHMLNVYGDRIQNLQNIAMFVHYNNNGQGGSWNSNDLILSSTKYENDGFSNKGPAGILRMSADYSEKVAKALDPLPAGADPKQAADRTALLVTLKDYMQEKHLTPETLARQLRQNAKDYREGTTALDNGTALPAPPPPPPGSPADVAAKAQAARKTFETTFDTLPETMPAGVKPDSDLGKLVTAKMNVLKAQKAEEAARSAGTASGEHSIVATRTEAEAQENAFTKLFDEMKGSRLDRVGKDLAALGKPDNHPGGNGPDAEPPGAPAASLVPPGPSNRGNQRAALKAAPPLASPPPATTAPAHAPKAGPDLSSMPFIPPM